MKTLIDFLVMQPEWFVAMWVALVVGSVWLLVDGLFGGDEDA